MRIGLLLYGTLETQTGGTLYDRMVVAGLRRLGHEVTELALPPAGSYGKRLGHGLAPGLARRLLAAEFDLLLQDELCHPSLFLVNRRLRALGGPPLVAIVHHLLCREPRQRWLNRLLAGPERWYLQSVDGFICNSQTTRHTVEAMVGGGRPLVVAYPAGDRFARLPTPTAVGARACRPGPLQLLFVGALIPRKGLLPLIRALAGVARGAWQLSVVGDPECAPSHSREVRALVNQLGLTGAVRFLGVCPDAEMAQIFAKHHLFCMPYAYEGFGIAILEAMAFGLPAVGCRSGAAGETIRPGENGFLLAPDDQEGLIRLLDELQGDRARLATLAQGALTTFASRPGWQETAAAVDGFIRRLPARRGRP